MFGSKMIFPYLYPVWIEEGSTIEDDKYVYKVVTKGFYAFWIDIERMEQELGFKFENDINNLFVEVGVQGFPYIKAIEISGDYISQYEIHMINSPVNISYGNPRSIFIDKKGNRCFSSGDRLIYVSKNQIRVSKRERYIPCIYEVVRLPSIMDEWPISFFKHISPMMIPKDTVFKQDNALFRSTKNISLIWIDITTLGYLCDNFTIYTCNSNIPCLTHKDSFIGYRLTNEHLHLSNIEDKEHTFDREYTPISFPFLYNRSFSYGKYTVIVINNSVRVIETYPETLFKSIVLEYHDLVII